MALTERDILSLKLRAELEPGNVPLLLELGEAYERAGLAEAASHSYQRVLALDPENPLARRGRLRHFCRAYVEAAARGDGYERAAIVHQVGELGDHTATTWLVGLLDDGEPVVCQKAAEALGKIGHRAAVPALIRLLRSDEACAWWQAAEAVAAIGDRAAVAPLLNVLSRGSPNARAAAAHALGLLGDPAALAPLADVLAQADAPLRRAAATALGQLRDTSCVPFLAAALDDPDPETRAATVASLEALVGHRFRGSILSTADRAARRWWDKNGRFRHWGRRAPPQAALAARRRRQDRDDRRALVVGAAAALFAILGLVGIAAFLSIVLGIAPGSRSGHDAPPRRPGTASSR